jgi:hypothetical protein
MTMTLPLSISFGHYVTAADVSKAVQATIELWSATYLAEMSRHDGQDPLTDPSAVFPDFASYPDSLDLSRFPEEQLPACILVVPGITETPRKAGGGKVSAVWKVGIGVAVTSQDKPTTIKLAQLYTSAVRMIILQNPSLGGFATGVTWLREEYTGNIIRADDTRTLAIGVLDFNVTVDANVDADQGPVVPILNNEPPTGWATVETPSITITGDAVGTEL